MAKGYAPHTMAQVLSPQAKDALQHLELFARRHVGGILHGVHRAKRLGVSTEFDHHKQYQPGDALKHIDWKVTARQEKVFVKRYLEDTALSVRIVVDCSASMAQQSGEASKYLQASRMAAAMAYLIINQGDSVGLMMTAGERADYLRAGSTANHLVQLLSKLAQAPIAEGDRLPFTLKAMVERNERKGLVILVSDLMFDPDPVQRELSRLQAQGHEVLLLQVRDAMEEDFPFNRWVEFRDLENPSTRHRLDAVPLKRFYREAYDSLMEDWRAWAKKFNAHFVTARTEEDMPEVLSTYMTLRLSGEI